MKPYPAKRPWTPGALRMLHRMCAKQKPVLSISQMLKRTEGAIRQKARHEGLSVGVNQRGVATARRRRHRAKRLGLS